MVVLFATACGDVLYTPGFMYQAQTPACERWVDGSRFELPRSVDVFASKPETAGNKLELGINYFVPREVEVSLASQDFSITLPRGPAIARGIVVHVDRTPTNVAKRESVTLSALPNMLRGLEQGDSTMYRVKLQFQLPLPERFDFTPPNVLIGGRSYPVRTYTYRFFEERSAYGLCT